MEKLYDYVRFDNVVYRTNDLGGDLQFYDIVKDDSDGLYRIYKHINNDFRLNEAILINDLPDAFEFGDIYKFNDVDSPIDLPKLDVQFYIEVVDGVVHSLNREVKVYDETCEHKRCIQNKEYVSE